MEELAMEYGYPYNGCGGNKEKRPPLKRGQLKLQIARTLCHIHIWAGGHCYLICGLRARMGHGPCTENLLCTHV